LGAAFFGLIHTLFSSAKNTAGVQIGFFTLKTRRLSKRSVFLPFPNTKIPF
jgi:hypothetical protein